jgi:hypothetical protein
MKRWALWLWFAWGFALPAQAWTDARVQDAVVSLELGADGRLGVVFDLGVEVRGGRLERLELAGLDPGLELDSEQPAWFSTEDGLSGEPQATARSGAVTLLFARGAAPRRGRTRIGVRYHVRGVAGALGADGRRTLAWTLPGWEMGLDRAQVSWDLPAGARAFESSDAMQTVSQRDQGARTTLTFVKTQLPRSLPWRIAVAVPARALGAAGASPVEFAPAASGEDAQRWGFGAAALFVLLLAHAGRQHQRKQAQRAGLCTRSRLGAVRALVLAALGLAVTVAAYAPVISLGALLAIGLLCADRIVAAGAPMGLGHFESMTSADLAEIKQALVKERVGRWPWVDAGSWSGALGLASCAGSVAWLSSQLPGAVWPLGFLCASLSWVASSRWRLPRSVAERAQRLLRAASELRLAGCAVRLVWFVPQVGARTEPRLRIVTANRHHGLLRLEVMTNPARGSVPLSLSVVATESSSVDRALSAETGWARQVSPGGKRVAFVRPLSDVNAGLSALLGTLGAYTQRSAHELLSEAKRAA